MNVGPESDLRTTSDEANLILQAFECVLPGKSFGYFSCPITSGKRLFEVMKLHCVTTRDDLIEKIGFEGFLSQVRWPNVKDASEVVTSVRKLSKVPVINTAELYIEHWSGSDYASFCASLIEAKVGAVYFHPDWPFSNGAVKEFVQCIRQDIPCSSVTGARIDVEEGIDLLGSAIETILADGLNPGRMLVRAKELHAML